MSYSVKKGNKLTLEVNFHKNILMQVILKKRHNLKWNKSHIHNKKFLKIYC